MSSDATMSDSLIGSSSIAAASVAMEDDVGEKLSSSLEDAHGNWICALCDTTGHGTKRKRKMGSRLVHDGCRQRKRQGRVIVKKGRRTSKRPASPSTLSDDVPLAPALRHTQTVLIPQTVAESLEPPSNAAASVVIQSAGKYATSAERMQQMSKFGFARVPATEESRRLVWQLMHVRTSKAESQKIAGEVTQVLLTPEVLKTYGDGQLHLELERLVRQSAKELGISGAEEKYVVDCKFLISRPKRGRQFPHFDVARNGKGRNMYTFLLCCTSGCSSTALPTFPLDDRMSVSMDRKQMREVAPLLRDCPENFQSFPMDVGDIIIFQQTVPHFGVANEMSAGNRQMFFCVLSDTHEWGQDEQQVPPWLFVADAFGWRSTEFAQSLVENRLHDPLARIADSSLDDIGPAVNALKRAGLVERYGENKVHDAMSKLNSSSIRKSSRKG